MTQGIPWVKVSPDFITMSLVEKFTKKGRKEMARRVEDAMDREETGLFILPFGSKGKKALSLLRQEFGYEKNLPKDMQETCTDFRSGVLSDKNWGIFMLASKELLDAKCIPIFQIRTRTKGEFQDSDPAATNNGAEHNLN